MEKRFWEVVLEGLLEPDDHEVLKDILNQRKYKNLYKNGKKMGIKSYRKDSETCMED